MNISPSELAAIFNGMSPASQVEFLAEIRPHSFFVADEMASNISKLKQTEKALETMANIMCEYALNYGDSHLVDGRYKGKEVTILVNGGKPDGLFYNGCCFITPEEAAFDEIDWTKVTVQYHPETDLMSDSIADEWLDCMLEKERAFYSAEALNE